MTSAAASEPPLRLLVSGATGFAGRHLARYLIAAGATLGCIVRPDSDLSTLPREAAALRHDGGTEQLHAIVRDFAPDCIVHLASHFVAEHQPPDVVPLVGANLLFATQLADAAAAAGVPRFVNTGTAWQHYEDAPYNPVCLYAATKQAFDDILRYYREAVGLRVVTLELSDTYGPGDPRRKLVPLLVDLARQGRALAMSPGEQRISLVFISDVVAAFVRAIGLTAELRPGEERRYAVTADEAPSLRALVALVEREAGRRLDIEWGGRPYRRREMMAPPPGQRLPGWKPAVDLQSGIRLVLEAEGVCG